MKPDLSAQEVGTKRRATRSYFIVVRLPEKKYEKSDEG